MSSVAAAPQHDSMTQFATVDNQLTLSGFSLNQIGAMLGKDVFYAYDKAVIAQQVTKFRLAIPDRIKLHYAVKANPNAAVVSFMRPLVDGFDVSPKSS